MTPLGPAWIRFSFGSDCTFTSRVQLLYARITESGRYVAANGVVTFERRSGTTRWPYRIDSGRLELQEAATEKHFYRARSTAPSPAAKRAPTSRRNVTAPSSQD